MSPVTLVIKNLAVNSGEARDTGLIPELEDRPGGRHGNLYSCLGHPFDGGGWWATVQSIGRCKELDTTEST